MSEPVEITRKIAAAAYQFPTATDDKYRRGVVQFLTGSNLYPGAGVLSVAGALGAGVGMIRYIGSAPQLVLSRFPEVVVHPGMSNVDVIGSGWGPSLKPMLPQCRADIAVIDAGAMFEPDVISGLRIRILTPHYGEAARLLGCHRDDVAADVVGAATELHQKLDSIVVVKGALTVVAGESLWSLTAPSHWAATAGAGDVLAGVIAAMVAQPHAEVELGVAGAVWLHAQAARSSQPIRALDIAQNLPSTVGELLE